MQPAAIIQALTLLAAANTLPVLATRLLGARFAWTLDGGFTFTDGRPIFGRSKTIRGVAFSLLGTAAVASIIGLDAKIGILTAAIAMAGDLLSSFIKRRLNLPSGSRAIGLDQLPESLLPLLTLTRAFHFTVVDILAIAMIFSIGELLLSRLFYQLGLRERPY